MNTIQESKNILIAKGNEVKQAKANLYNSLSESINVDNLNLLDLSKKAVGFINPSTLYGARITTQSYNQRTVSGVVDGSNVEFLEIEGQTVKFNQLLDKANYPTTQTVNGITFTNNNDGKIVANGTATKNTYLTIIIIAVKENHKYLVKGCPNGGSDITYFFSSSRGWKDYGNGLIFTEGVYANHNWFIYPSVRVGYTATNLVFKPQLFDLTAMGLDSITTVEQFNSLFPNDLYDYDTGSLKNTVLKGIRNNVDGINLDMELGKWDSLNKSSNYGGITTQDYLPYTDKNYIINKQSDICVINGTQKILSTSVSVKDSNVLVIAYEFNSLGMTNIINYDEDVTIEFYNSFNSNYQVRNDFSNISFKYIGSNEVGLNTLTGKNGVLIVGINGIATQEQANAYLAQNPLIVRYQTSVPIYTPIDLAPLKYQEFNGDIETVLNENKDYGNIPTITRREFTDELL